MKILDDVGASWEVDGSVLGSLGAFEQTMWCVDSETCSYTCTCDNENGICDKSAIGWSKNWYSSEIKKGLKLWRVSGLEETSEEYGLIFFIKFRKNK